MLVLACPKCKHEVKRENDSVICVDCGLSFCIKNNVPMLLDTTQEEKFSGIECRNTFLEKIKMRFKKWPKVYSALVFLISPILFTGRSNRILLDRIQKPDQTVVNVGAGVSGRVSKNSYNMDIYPYQDIDVIGDAAALPFLDCSLDGIILDTVLEHIKNPCLAVKESYRVLKTGGYIYATMPFMEGFHGSPSDYWRFSVQGVDEIFKDFKKIESGNRGGPASAFVWISQEFLANLFSFNSVYLYSILSIIFMALLSPIKILDIFLSKYGSASNISACFYYFGEKQDD